MSDEELFIKARQLYKNKLFVDAFNLYLDLAQRGHNSAKIFIGWMYFDGIGIQKDVNLALFWFNRAAEQGSPEGLFYCGKVLELEGRNAESIQFIMESAEKGYIPGVCRLGLMYLEGKFVNRDEQLAIEFLRRAANHGNVFAKREIAVMLIKKPNLFKKIEGTVRFILAVIESFFIGLIDPYSEKLRF